MSARERRPSTGRTNLDSDGAKTWQTHGPQSWRCDPLQVRRPFTPSDSQLPLITRKRYLPKERHLMVTQPPPPEPKWHKKRNICPEGFVAIQMEPTWFEKIDSKAMVDEQFKSQMAREFVTRNKDRMWMFDIRHHKMTPRASCDMLLGEMNFMKLMKVYHRIENGLDRGTSSHKIAHCLTETNLAAPTQQPSADPFKISLKTSRTNRDDKINNMLAPARRGHADSFRRGALHAPDWGNFSRYNGFLAKNI